MITHVFRHGKLVEVKETLGFGDKVWRIAQPIARAIDKVLGTNIRNCKRCKKRKRKLNQIGRKKRN